MVTDKDMNITNTSKHNIHLNFEPKPIIFSSTFTSTDRPFKESYCLYPLKSELKYQIKRMTILLRSNIRQLTNNFHNLAPNHTPNVGRRKAPAIQQRCNQA